MHNTVTLTYLLTLGYAPGRGLKAIVYLDDGVVDIRGKNRAMSESDLIWSTGFVINEKSQWDLSHNIEWLRFVIDLSKGDFSVPNCKISRLRSKLQELKMSNLLVLGKLPVS